MGSSSSRLRRRQRLQQQQQLQHAQQDDGLGPFAHQPPGAFAGAGGHGAATQQQHLPQQGSHRPPGIRPGTFSQQPSAGQSFGQPPRAPAHSGASSVPSHEYQQTATVKNQVNLRKPTMKITPVEGRPHDFELRFSFDATAACRVTTFLLATEEPRDGCRVRSAVIGAPPRPPVYYQRGMDLKFPPPGDAAAGEAHVISSIRAPLGHMMLASGDSYPLVVRLEALTQEGRAQGRTLEELEVGGAFPPWVQAQTTYAKLQQDDDGDWQVVVLKQKIWVNGLSYELQDIYGLEASRRMSPSRGQGGGAPYDELEGRECVVCMSDGRDTMVLPCRHMCMCQECATELRTKTNKCPICRNEISSLLHIKIRRKTSSKNRRSGEQPPPAAGGAPASG